MTRIILHVGMHKTGTTTIQNTLFEHRHDLEAVNIFYPAGWEIFGGNRETQSATAHFRFAAALTQFKVEEENKLYEFRKLIEEKLKNNITVILSAESLYRHIIADENDPGNKENQRYVARKRFVKRLAEYFDGLPVEVVLYLRRPDSFAESMYGEVLVNSENRQYFHNFLKTDLYRFDYKFQIDLLTSFFNTRVLVFEEEVKKGLTQSLFSCVNLLGAPPDESSLRVSISKKAAQWILQRKLCGGITPQDRQRSWLFALQPSSQKLFWCDPSASFFNSLEERDIFNDQKTKNIEHIFPPAKQDFKTLPPLASEEIQNITIEYMRWARKNRRWLIEREEKKLSPFVKPIKPELHS